MHLDVSVPLRSKLNELSLGCTLAQPSLWRIISCIHKWPSLIYFPKLLRGSMQVNLNKKSRLNVPEICILTCTPSWRCLENFMPAKNLSKWQNRAFKRKIENVLLKVNHIYFKLSISKTSTQKTIQMYL